MKDYYSILGLSRNASQEEIKRAFRRASQTKKDEEVIEAEVEDKDTK